MWEWCNMAAMKRLALGIWRFYLQFLFIILIGALFAYVLNGVLAIDDDKSRILFSAIFLMFFSGALVMAEKVL